MKYNALLHGSPARWDSDRKPALGGDGGGGSGTSSTTPQIPEELKPLANLYVKQATQIANNPFQSYNAPRYADLNANQNAGIDLVANRALNGSPTMANAESNLNQFIQGGNTNPYLDAMFNQAANQVKNNVNSNFELAGRYGSGAHTGELAQQLGNMATQMYGNAYNTDQANRMQAIGMAPTFGNAAYQDANQLLNAGSIQQQNAQNPLDFAYQQYQNAQDYPFKQLQATGGVIQGNMGSQTTSTQSSGGK